MNLRIGGGKRAIVQADATPERKEGKMGLFNRQSPKSYPGVFSDGKRR